MDKALQTARKVKREVFTQLKLYATDISTLAQTLTDLFVFNDGRVRVNSYNHSVHADGWLPCKDCTEGKYTIECFVTLNDLGDYNRVAEDFGMWKYRALGGTDIHYTPNLYREDLSVGNVTNSIGNFKKSNTMIPTPTRKGSPLHRQSGKRGSVQKR